MCKLINRVKSLVSRKSTTKTLDRYHSEDGTITYSFLEKEDCNIVFSRDTETGKLLCEETTYTSGDLKGVIDVLSYVYDENGRLCGKYWHSWNTESGDIIGNSSHTYLYNENGERTYWWYCNHITGTEITEGVLYTDPDHKIVRYEDSVKTEVTKYERRTSEFFDYSEWKVIDQSIIKKDFQF